LGATSANVLKRASHVYIRLKKWIIDSAFRILQNAEKLMQAFFSVKGFLEPDYDENAASLYPTQRHGGRKVVTAGSRCGH
jgi:hypothetical protein